MSSRIVPICLPGNVQDACKGWVLSAHRSRAAHLALCTHIVARMQRHWCVPTVTSCTSCCRQGRHRGGAQRRRERQGVHHCAVRGPVHVRALFEDCWNLKRGFALLHLSEEELGTPSVLCAAASCQTPEPLRPSAQGGGAHGRLLGLGHARPAAGGAWAVNSCQWQPKLANNHNMAPVTAAVGGGAHGGLLGVGYARPAAGGVRGAAAGRRASNRRRIR